jgi:hypothetical protein
MPRYKAKGILSDAHRKAISDGRKGMTFSAEHRANLSTAGKGLPAWNKGVPMSEAAKAKLKKTFTGRARTPYGRGGAVSPDVLPYVDVLCPLGYELDAVTIPIPTGSAYKLDFAHREAKVNIEIDGRSHRDRQEQDARRDAYLQSLGWKVIRICV